MLILSAVSVKSSLTLNQTQVRRLALRAQVCRCRSRLGGDEMPSLPPTPRHGPSLPGVPRASRHTGQRVRAYARHTGHVLCWHHGSGTCRSGTLALWWVPRPKVCLQCNPRTAQAGLGAEGLAGQRTAKSSLLLPEQFV